MRVSIQAFLNPLLIACIPALFLAGRNLSEAPGKEIVIATLCSMGFAYIVMTLCLLLTKKRPLASFCTSLFLILFFSYGAVYDILSPSFINNTLFSIALSGLLLALMIGLSWVVIKSDRYLDRFNRFISPFAIMMLCLSLLFLVIQPAFLVKIKKIPLIIFSQSQPQSEVAPNTSPSVVPQGSKSLTHSPDIYYVILDGYARSDVLSSVFDYDNTLFENNLKNKGFYIAPLSTTNYPMTHLSLASSLNMTHLDLLSGHSSQSITPYYQLIQQPHIAELLKSWGYRYITVSSGWGPTGLPSPLSDAHYAPKMSTLSNYYQALLSMTPLKSWVGNLQVRVRLFAFDALKSIAQDHAPQPKFVFLHLVMPHPPYLFDRQGNIKNIHQGSVAHDDDKEAYIDQLAYLNTRIFDCIEVILRESTNTPIIILQADHGSETRLSQFKGGEPNAEQLEERYPIFNAYFGPDAFIGQLYPTITPVNSFRQVLHYLGQTQWDPMPDSNYFQWYNDNTQSLDVTQQVALLGEIE